jgi:hypothetical protein
MAGTLRILATPSMASHTDSEALPLVPSPPLETNVLIFRCTAAYAKRHGGRVPGFSGFVGFFPALLAEQGDLGSGRGPIGIASITVKNECSGFQNVLEFFLAELDGLIMVVRTDDFKRMTLTHGGIPL